MTAASTDASKQRRRINFEVSVRRSRKWQVYATYNASERDLALADAAKLERDGGVDGTKVTKETENLETNKVECTVIFRSAALEREMVEMAAERPRARKKEAAPPQKPSPPAKPTPKQAVKEVEDLSLLRAAPAILVSFLLSCMVGALLTVGASYSLQTVVGMGLQLDRKAQLAVLLGIFTVTAAYTLFFLLRRIMKRVIGKCTVNVRAAGHAAKAVPAANAQPPAPAVGSPLAPQPSQRLGDAEQLVTAFADRLLANLGEGLDRLDAGQRFALDVYMGGAVEALIQSQGLNRDDFQLLLQEPLRRLGAPPELVQRFGGLIEGYLAQPRVQAVYDLGREAMAALLAGNADTIDPEAALRLWQDPKAAQDPEAKAEPPASEQPETADEPEIRFVAVLYSDAIIPAALTQGRGRKAARRMFKSHAKIVRDVLAKLDGSEFEHDGDGILASFEVPSRAVEAALKIQAGIAAAPDDKKSAARLAARIGIDAGESMHDDGELLGTTVELAFYLCDRGEAGQILASGKVRDLCASPGSQFAHIGEERVAGFAEAVSLFKIVSPDGSVHSRPSGAVAGAE